MGIGEDMWHHIDGIQGVFHYDDITAAIFYHIDGIEDIFDYMNIIQSVLC